jgi:hypothetical protein
VRAGTGTVGVALAVPPGASSRTFLNRNVRPFLQALPKLGAPSAHYFGRDHIVSGMRQIAVISQEGRPDGALLMEAVIAVGRSLALPEGAYGYRPHDDPRAAGVPHGHLAGERSFEDVVAALTAAFGAEPGGTAPTPVPLAPPVEEDEEGFRWSGQADVPIGFVEALVRGDEVRLRGDFIAPAWWIASLERGERPEHPASFVFGASVRDLLDAPVAARQ